MRTAAQIALLRAEIEVRQAALNRMVGIHPAGNNLQNGCGEELTKQNALHHQFESESVGAVAGVTVAAELASAALVEKLDRAKLTERPGNDVVELDIDRVQDLENRELPVVNTLCCEEGELLIHGNDACVEHSRQSTGHPAPEGVQTGIEALLAHADRNRTSPDQTADAKVFWSGYAKGLRDLQAGTGELLARNDWLRRETNGLGSTPTACQGGDK